MFNCNLLFFIFSPIVFAEDATHQMNGVEYFGVPPEQLLVPDVLVTIWFVIQTVRASIKLPIVAVFDQGVMNGGRKLTNGPPNRATTGKSLRRIIFI